MKIAVDCDLCIGCGLCEETCPDVFDVGDDGCSRVLGESPDPILYGDVREAAEECPTGAISIAAD